MTRIAVCLAGCGVNDGSEIHESVLTLLALSRAGVKVQCCAPDDLQHDLVNHLNGDVQQEGSRNILEESARIARGEIVPLSKIDAADFDAIIFPGGFGAAKNLCDFALVGADARAHPEVERVICNFVDSQKVLGFICIAPAICASALRNHHVVPELTIGNCPETAKALETMGAKHVASQVDQIHVDVENRIVSTPAYMLATNLVDLAKGIDSLVNQVVAMCKC
jgi:enhancing lycopene biosynthesis protein 2